MATLAQDSGHVVMQAPMQTPSSSSSGGIPTTSIDSVFLLGETSARMYLNQTTTSNHESTAMQYANYQEPVINHHNHHELTNAIILENHEFGNNDLPSNTSSSSLLTTEAADVVPTTTPPLTEMTTLPSMFSTTPQLNNANHHVDILAHTIDLTFENGANGGDIMGANSHADERGYVDNFPIMDHNQPSWNNDYPPYTYGTLPNEWYVKSIF